MLVGKSHFAVLVATVGLSGFVGCAKTGGIDEGGDDSLTASAGSGGQEASATAPDGTDDDGGSETGDADDELAFEPAPGGARRLLLSEYSRSVERMFGSEAAQAVHEPSDLAHHGWDAVGATLLSVAPLAIESYERVAAAVATAAVEDMSTLAIATPCIASQQNQACYEQVASRVGHWAYRRPLQQAEIDALVEIALAARSWGEGDFLAGLKYELMAILQAPSFIYVLSVGERDPETGFRKLTPSELATRLSFFLLGRNPDLELLEMADAGGLDSPDQVRDVATEMIDDPEARLAFTSFFDELLRLRYLSEATKSPELFPLYDASLAGAMRQETLLLVDDVVWQRDADYRELFNARYTFVNDALAELYGMSPIGGAFSRVDFPAGQKRSGYLSQPSFLTVHSTATRTSPTKRGKYIQERVLCRPIPAPDPEAELNLPDPQPGMTMRDLLEQHMENPGCRTCHALIDPLGFAFEHYDAVGQYRELDNGSPVDASGDIEDLGAWDDAAALGDLLASDPRTGACLIENLVAGRLGHLPLPGEEDLLARLADEAAEDGFSMRSIIIDLVTSPLFAVVDEPK